MVRKYGGVVVGQQLMDGGVENCWRRNSLDAEAGLSPVPSLRVVAVRIHMLAG